MYSEYNHIYTNKGIYSVYDLYALKQNKLLNTIKVMSYDIANHVYQFVDINDITLSSEMYDIYEINFFDIYSDKISVVNGTGDLSIYQFDIINIQDDYMQTRKSKVNQYIQQVLSNSDIAANLHFEAKQIKSLINYSVNMPNIALGDTLVKFKCKILKNQEPVYEFKDANNESIPLFIGQTINSFYNFILAK